MPFYEKGAQKFLNKGIDITNDTAESDNVNLDVALAAVLHPIVELGRNDR